jgi:hypothetical protein
MLRWFKIPALNDVADLIMQTWEASEKPTWVIPFTLDSEMIADFYFSQTLNALGKRSLSELGPDLNDDIRRAVELEPFLSNGLGGPDATLPASARWRHVPVAAQLAFIKQKNPDSTTLNRIQERALSYLGRIPRPNKMGATGTSKFFEDLMRDLKLS